ncbi:hypothetical protein JCM10908_007396 [Rhodotorula pacifica]|uniref:uncharacterized protein n=1 Tax=Rhodotorula pacifica TaxID=1495444 RepID=UPI00317FE9B1
MPPAPTVARASAMATVALRTQAPTPYLRRRNDVNASLAQTISAVQQQASSATGTSSAPSSTSTGSGYTNNGGWFGNVWGGSFSTNWVTWVSIVVLVGLLLGISTARFFYIRRYYPPTWRSYFIPAKGLHIKRLGINIRGPPPRVPREDPPPYFFATEYGPYSRRRRRRGRQTVGETVGEGGARIGERDQDDMWDVDVAGSRAGTPGVARDELPRYFLDGGLPMYEIGDGSAAEEAERIRAEAAAADELEVMPTAAEYEAAIRAGRNTTAESGRAHPEGPEGTHGIEGQTAAAAADNGAAAYPPRPPPVARSTTGRSSILAAFSRGRASSPERDHQRGNNASRPRLGDNGTNHDDEDFASSSASTSTVSTTLGVLPAIRRTMSVDSGATGSSEDKDPLGTGPVKKLQATRPGMREASSSSVKIDPEAADKEEVNARTKEEESPTEEREDVATNPNADNQRNPDPARDSRHP